MRRPSLLTGGGLLDAPLEVAEAVGLRLELVGELLGLFGDPALGLLGLLVELPL